MRLSTLSSSPPYCAVSRQKAEEHMYPAGVGSQDIFLCFQRIKAARLQPNEKTLLMASSGVMWNMVGWQSSFANYSKPPTRRQKETFSMRLKTRPCYEGAICRMRHGWLSVMDTNKMRKPDFHAIRSKWVIGEARTLTSRAVLAVAFLVLVLVKFARFLKRSSIRRITRIKRSY